MDSKLLNSTQIELFGTDIVKDYLLQTDTLRPYIKENDKTPLWDGSVIIYNCNSSKKRDIIGTITVQVKGHTVDDINKDEFAFGVDLPDLINYRNDGGTIFFVVLIDINRPLNRSIYYETLTPMKISDYIKGHEQQKSRTIHLSKLPEDKYKIQTIFYNFLKDSRKQHSFSDIPPIQLDELSKRKDITSISGEITIFSPSEIDNSPIQVLLNNDVQLYANIAGSVLPHPIEWCKDLRMEFTEKEGLPPIFVNGEKYENYLTVSHKRDGLTLRFGKSTTLKISNEGNEGIIQYMSADLLSDRIKDLNFIICLVETGVIDTGNGRILPLEPQNLDTSFNIKEAKCTLCRYKEIDLFWKSIGVIDDFNIGAIESNSNFKELELLMKSINGRKALKINTDKKYECYLFQKKISNFQVLFFIKSVDKERSTYEIFDYLNYKGIVKIILGDDEHITSIYSALTPNHYAELSNIDYSRILQSYKDVLPLNNNIFTPANINLLNMLKAYDSIREKPFQLLNAAKDIALWIKEESSNLICHEIKTLNYLQVIKRERELNDDENIELVNIADKSKDLMFKLGANILLDNYKVAQVQYSKLSKDKKGLFQAFPINNLWNNTIQN